MKKLLILLTAVLSMDVFASEVTGTQNCTTHGGVIESMPAKYEDKAESYAFFGPAVNVCKINTSIIGIDTLSAKPTIAATYLRKLNKKAMTKILDDMTKLPNYYPGANQSSYLCQLLNGQENAYKDTTGETNVCYFSDLSSVDSWTLLYTTNGEDSKVKKLIQSKALKTPLPYIK